MRGNFISHYRILEKSGMGRTGNLFLAHNTSLDRESALKFLPDIFSGNPKKLARFERKVGLVASLSNENRPTGVLLPCDRTFVSREERQHKCRNLE